MNISERIDRKFTKYRLENTFTRKERLKCKKDAKKILRIIKKQRRITKNKHFAMFSAANCKAIIRLANRGNKNGRIKK